MANHLIHNGFNPDAARLSATIYKVNSQFANLNPSDSIRLDGGEDSREMTNKLEQERAKREQANVLGHIAAVMGQSVSKEFTFPLPDGVASLRVPFPLTEEGFSVLIQMLHVSKSGIVKTQIAVVSTGDADWEAQAEALAAASLPFNVLGFRYAHHIGFYNTIATKYNLESRFDPVKGEAYFRPGKKA